MPRLHPTLSHPTSPHPFPRSKKSDAKVGRIHTPHGVIDTPGFVAVATNGALKAVDISWADAEGLQLMFWCALAAAHCRGGPRCVQ